MKHKKNHSIKPHSHSKRLSKIFYTTEVLFLLKGKLRVDFYTEKQKYLFSKIIKANNIIILIKGGHGFKVIQPIEMLEVKQGPYNLIKDKVKFSGIYEKKSKKK